MTEPPATAVTPVKHPGTTWLLLEVDESDAGSRFLNPGDRLVAGRGSTVDLTLRDPGVSRRHFEVESLGDQLALRDLGSKGGTFVNGRQVSEATLGPGDRIEAGSSDLVVLQVQAKVPKAERGVLEVVHYSSGQPGARVVIDRPLLIGRSTDCDIVIDNTRVSRRHLEVRPGESSPLLVDLAPNNRADVNGRRLTGPRPLSPGDRIQLAEVDEVLVIESPQTAVGPIAVEVVDEEGQALAVEIDAGVESNVADVANRVREFVGHEGLSKVWTLYQAESGVILNPSNRWADSGVRRGDSLLLLGLDESPAASTQAVRFGPPRVTLNQLPRAVTPPEARRVRTPRAPETQSLRGRGVSWQIIGGLGIIFAGIMMVFINPNYAPFAVIGGVVGVISVGSGIMGEQSRRKFGVRQFREKIETLDQELHELRKAQGIALHQVNASPSKVVRWVSERSRRLWERRPHDPDFLRLRIGLGTRLSLLDIDDQALISDSPFVSEVRELLERHRFLENVPVLLPSPEKAPIIGIVGSRRDVFEVSSWLLLQAAALHSPADLSVVVPAVNQDWLWARWLPHLESADGVQLTWNDTDASALARKLSTANTGSEARSGLNRAQQPERLVVVPHGASEIFADLMANDSGGGTLYLVLADRASDLPNRIDAVVSLSGETASIEGPNPDGAIGPIVLDRVSPEVAASMARRMGRFEDARKPARAASSQLGLLDLMGVADPSDFDLGSLWANNHAPLSAVVGTTSDESPLVLGFRSDGVHGVVGGTTGSGKSEFLQTLLMSLALTHRPDQLNFFLIDFKGGATFAALSGLPHVAGVVTDLEKDASLANRAFTSLEAEMARRKKVLDSARVPGLIEYERLPEAGANPMPALLVVIDEFALLVRQQPEVKERLDLVATQGRSLGVHLLLATQSPSNVITPSIRTNTQVWISLRVVDDSESTELLGHRDAARIPPDRPGRGFVRFGGSQSITGFQTARIARPIGKEAHSAGVTVRTFADIPPAEVSAEPTRVPEQSGRVVTELEVVCSTVARQAKELREDPAKPLWLDPLPELLPAPTTSDGLIHEPGALRAMVGLRDDPARHIQEPFSVDLRKAGNLLVVGTRGTGKSNTIQQIAFDLADRNSPAALHLYGVESGTGSLNRLSDLPHTGAVVAGGDRERTYRLFGRLVGAMEKRRESLAASGFNDFESWRRGSAEPEPWILLVIDDYASFKEVADGSGFGLLNEQLISLAQGGPSVGIHLIMTATQSSDMRMNLVNLFGSRILLRQVDAADYNLLELRLRPGELPPDIPGRALVAGGYEVQVFHSQENRTASIRSSWDGAAGGPEPIARLPVEIEIGALTGDGRVGPVIGVAGPEHDPLVLDLHRMGPHLLIVGEGRSGRSTALLTIGEALADLHADALFAVFCPRPSPLQSLAVQGNQLEVAVSYDEMSSMLDEIKDSSRRVFLLIDDAESVPTEVGSQLEPILRNARQTNLASFVAGRTADISRSFESWSRYLLSLRSGILLMPAPDSGHVFEVRLPPSHVAMTPGRGFLCDRGEATFVQFALPSSNHRPDVRPNSEAVRGDDG